MSRKIAPRKKNAIRRGCAGTFDAVNRARICFTRWVAAAFPLSRATARRATACPRFDRGHGYLPASRRACRTTACGGAYAIARRVRGKGVYREGFIATPLNLYEQ